MSTHAVASLLVGIGLCGFALGCADRSRRTLTAPAPATLPTTEPLTKPVLPPITQPAYAVSEVAERTLDAVPVYVHVSTQTNFRDVQKSIDAALADLSAAQAGGRVKFVGPPVLVYRGTASDPDKPFTLDVGYPAAVGARAAGRVRVGTLAGLRVAAVEYQGPTSAIDKAYDRLLPAMKARALTPTGEAREVYLQWDGVGSANNRVLVAAGVK